jgi:hypothetical protein
LSGCNSRKSGPTEKSLRLGNLPAETLSLGKPGSPGTGGSKTFVCPRPFTCDTGIRGGASPGIQCPEACGARILSDSLIDELTPLATCTESSPADLSHSALSEFVRCFEGMGMISVPADPHFAVWGCGEEKVLMAISTSLVRYINGRQRDVAHCYRIWTGHSLVGRSRMLWRPTVTLRVPSLCFSPVRSLT